MRFFAPLLFSASLALAAAGPAVVWAGQITVTGTGTVQVVPDLATVSLGVTTEGPSASDAMAANSKALAAVMARLKAAGIAERDMQTSNLSLNPNWVNYDNGTAPQIQGYVASNMLTVQVRDLAAIGGVLDAVVADGANTLNGLSFGLADPRPKEDEARKAAVADAVARARLLAEAAGAHLGAIVSITEGGFTPGPMPMFAKAAESAAVPVAAGEVEVSASVTMVFDIAQ